MENSSNNTDIEIIVHGVSFKAARSDLMTKSKYIEHILFDKKDSKTVYIEGIKPAAFATVLNWFQTSYLEITEENCLDIFAAAELLSISELFQDFKSFLYRLFHSSHPIFAKRLIKKSNSTLLRQLTDEALAENFGSIINTHRFLELGTKQLCGILNTNTIAANSEVDVLAAAVKWLSHDWPRRQKHASEVISHIRLAYMSDEEWLASYGRPDISAIFELQDCLPLVFRALIFHIATKTGKSDSFTALTQPRNYLPTERKLSTTSTILDQTSTNLSTKQDALRSHKSMPVLQTVKPNADNLSPHKISKSMLLPSECDQRNLITVVNDKPKDVSSSPHLHQENKSNFKVYFPANRGNSDTGESDDSKDESYTVELNPVTQKNKTCKLKCKKTKTHTRTLKSSSFECIKHPTKQTNGKLPCKSSSTQTIDDLIQCTPCTVDKDSEMSCTRHCKAKKTMDHDKQLYTKKKCKLSKSRMDKDGTINKTIVSDTANKMLKSKHKLLTDLNITSEQCKYSMVVVGGLNPLDEWNAEPTGKTIFSFSPDDKSWKCDANLPEPRYYAAVAILKEKLYILGGCNPKRGNNGLKISALPSTICFNIRRKEWCRKRSLTYSRIHHCAVVANGKIYVIGGSDQYTRLLASVECYDSSNNKWQEVAPLPHAVMGMSAAYFQDKIWVCGGITTDKENRHRHTVDHVQCYHPPSNIWGMVTERLRFPRCFSSMAIWQDKLFLVGGAVDITPKKADRLRSIRAVDAYFADKNQWEQVTTLRKRRHSCRCAVIGNFLYIVGGISSATVTALSDVECVQLETMEFVSAPGLPYPLSGMGMAIMKWPSKS